MFSCGYKSYLVPFLKKWFFVFIFYIDLWHVIITIFSFLSLYLYKVGERYIYGWWQDLSFIKKWRDTNSYTAYAFLDILVKLLC